MSRSLDCFSFKFKILLLVYILAFSQKQKEIRKDTQVLWVTYFAEQDILFRFYLLAFCHVKSSLVLTWISLKAQSQEMDPWETCDPSVIRIRILARKL